MRHDATERSTFPIFIITITIIIIQCSCVDSFSVKVPERRLTAARGHAVILGCEFSHDVGSNLSLSNLVVTWQRQEDNRVVHSYYYGQNQLGNQDSAYRSRTSLFENELSKGNASVKIKDVGVKDAGLYLCSVNINHDTDKAALQLDYGAFYTEPRLTISEVSSDILVQYETEGFPAPEVTWKGVGGQNLSSQIATSMRSDDRTGLYYIRSSYTAPKSELNFTFILENQLLHQHMQRHVSYIGSQDPCHTKIVALGICLFIVALAAVVLSYLYFCRPKGQK